VVKVGQSIDLGRIRGRVRPLNVDDAVDRNLPHDFDDAVDGDFDFDEDLSDGLDGYFH
jgi:hypothetical protein